MNNLEKIFYFIQVIWNLKNTYRWCKTNDWREESTAEHSWRMAMMAILYYNELKLDLDLEKILKLAIIHDLAEVITWDYDAWETHKNSELQKNKEDLELEAMEKLILLLPKDLWVDVFWIWKEYEDRNTKESKFIKALDKLEALSQIIEMWYKYYDKEALFFTTYFCDKAILDFPELMDSYFVMKRKLKEEYLKWWFEWKDEYDVINEKYSI